MISGKAHFFSKLIGFLVLFVCFSQEASCRNMTLLYISEKPLKFYECNKLFIPRSPGCSLILFPLVYTLKEYNLRLIGYKANISSTSDQLTLVYFQISLHQMLKAYMLYSAFSNMINLVGRRLCQCRKYYLVTVQATRKSLEQQKIKSELETVIKDSVIQPRLELVFDI